ncbi:OmpP1/FadL family transporter [Parafilimonas sp.]|uniref:OmpP1/FadL family transporter n=1 Tax=Parafilimonas sp. TaxID=1969739 RepID=UPI0039E682A2
MACSKKYICIPKLLLSAVMAIGSTAAFAQNVTSPYSIFGVGDIETKDFGRYFGMGSTSIALRSGSDFNFSNPASLTALDPKIMNFDFIMRGRISNFRTPGQDTVSSASKDYAIRRISLAYKPEKRWAFAFGLRPYSTVNYMLNTSSTLGDNTSELEKSVDGNGGIYQAFLSNGFALTKNLSVGLTTSVLFGSLETNTTYTSSSIGLDVTRNEYDALHALMFTGGLQYVSKINNHISQQIGFTISNAAKLTGQYSTEYVTSDSTISRGVDPAKHITLPMQVGVGYALIFNDKLTASADYTYYNWSHKKLSYSNAYIDKAFRFSSGVEYSFKTKAGLQSVEKYYLQAGFSCEQSYIRIQNSPLLDYSYSIGFGNRVTSGLGYRLSNGWFGYNLGLEFGRKGSLGSNQIREDYVQFIVGLSLKGFWYNAAKYGKYN